MLSQCRTASLLWFHCAKGAKPSFIRPLPRFPAEIVHVTTYKKNGTWLIFSAIFKVFLLLWAASAKLLKKLRFPSFQWFSLQFSSFSFALGRSIRGNCRKSCNFHAFPTAGQPHFYDFIVLRDQDQYLSSIAQVPCRIWAWHYIQADGTWLIFSANFNFSLCFGRLLPNCWKSRSFHPFNGFLCHFLVLTLLWGAPSGTTV